MLASSTIIEDVDAIRKAGLASVAFFYCDFREEEKTGLRGLLSSLLAQLCHQSDRYCDILSKFYSDHAKGLRRPSDDSLVGCLKDLLNLPGLAPVYIIVDALDECPNTSTTSVQTSRAEVLNLLEEVIKSRIPNLRICVTSRPEADIKKVLDPLIPAAFPFMTRQDKSETLKSISSRSLRLIPKIEAGKKNTGNWSSTSSRKKLGGCKASILNS
jgi:hypothetical protein